MPGVIGERCLRQIQRGDNGAAVKICRRSKAKTNFGYRKRGCKATSIPSAPAKTASIAFAVLAVFTFPLFAIFCLNLSIR